MAKPDGNTVWNVVLSTTGVALIAVIGWQALEIVALKAEMQTMQATRFTEAHGEKMRSDVTDITTDIDKRLSLTEKDVEWVKMIMMSAHGREVFKDVGAELDPPPPPDVPAPAPPTDGPKQELQQLRRYDIRGR